MTESLFFVIINAEKGIVIRCGEKGRSWGERRVFDGKNISDREFFLPAEVSGRAGTSGGYGKIFGENGFCGLYIYHYGRRHIAGSGGRADCGSGRSAGVSYKRRIGEPPDPYAFYRETAQNRAEVFVGRWYLAEVEKYEVVFLSLLALERRLAEQPCLILHCAYTEYQGKAMLFSAPSGTGKTTQAGLWEQYRESRTVNGDKALLEYDGTAWTANGWPVCGTSGVCENKKLPVGCIVMLSQAKTNQAWRLRPAEAFTSLYGQITMNRWDREGLVHSLDLLEQLAGKVPVYHLACDISEDAVKTLEQEIGTGSFESETYAAALHKNMIQKREKHA